MPDKILDIVNTYYSEKVKEHGATPKGVDWNSSESQELRFQQLCKIIGADNSFSMLDFGCGYGAMFDYLKQTYPDLQYTGFDISETMISEALKKHNTDKNSKWITALNENEQYDFTIASGIFNVRLEIDDKQWLDYITSTLAQINKCSKKGFSFNMLTAYSDREYMRDYLYYASPTFFFDHCKQHFSKQVAVIHDYPLYEFTILVKK